MYREIYCYISQDLGNSSSSHDWFFLEIEIPLLHFIIRIMLR